MCIRGSNILLFSWFLILFFVVLEPRAGLRFVFLRESEEATGVFGCDFSDLLESQASFIGDSLCDERDIL